MTKKGKIFNYTMVFTTLVLVVVFAVINQQRFFKTLPTLITLIAMQLSARANRFTFLLGGINSVLYGIIYAQEALYFTALNCVLISAPLQLISFCSWTRNSYGKTATVFKRLTVKQLIFMILIHIPAWGLSYHGLSVFITGNFPVLDSFVFASGLIISVLSARRYIEAQYLNTINCVLSLLMWVMLCVKDLDNMNYAVIALYNVIMVAESAIVWTKKYNRQQEERQNNCSGKEATVY